MAANPPRVWEGKQGVVRISTGEPDKNRPLGYCEIGHWTLNARGELVVRNEDGKLLREHRLEPGQDPGAMAAKLLRVCCGTAATIGWPDKQNPPGGAKAVKDDPPINSPCPQNLVREARPTATRYREHGAS